MCCLHICMFVCLLPAVQHERGPRKPKVKMGEVGEEGGSRSRDEGESPMDLTVGGRCSQGLLPYKFPPTVPDTAPPPDGNALVLMSYVPAWTDIVRIQVHLTNCACVHLAMD